eukprot:11872971-Heterocapsa_arctica.AAC.1
MCGLLDRLPEVLDERARNRRLLPRICLALQPFEGRASRPRREDVVDFDGEHVAEEAERLQEPHAS